MADKSITSGVSAGEAVAVSTVAASPTSAPKGKRSTGAGSRASKKSAAPKKPKAPKQDKVTLTALDRILIFQSSLLELSTELKQPVDIAQGTGDSFLIRLPRTVGVCHHVDDEPLGNCLRMFLQRDPANPKLYCDEHAAAHSTASKVETQ